MIYAASTLAIAAFVVALWAFRIVPAAAKAVATSRGALAVMRDRTLSDDEKERASQKASLQLMGGFVSILARGVAALAASALPLFAFDAAELASLADSTAFLSTWEVIIGATVVMTAAYFLMRKQ